MNSTYTRRIALIVKALQLISGVGAVIICMASCKPLSKIANNSIKTEYITHRDFEKLNGVYSNNFDTIIGGVKHSPYDGKNDYKRLTILYQLFGYKYPETAWRDENGLVIKPEEKWIEIDFHTNKHATIRMFHRDKFVFSKEIRGKFKNGYFYLRPKAYILPFIPFVFGYSFEGARLGKTVEESLVIDYTVNRWGFAVVAGSEDKGAATTIYKRRNDQ